MKDGIILKEWISEHRVRPVEIYRKMDMSKQAFYKLYETSEFEDETKKKLEGALGVKWGQIKATVNVDPVNVAKSKEGQETPKNGSEVTQEMTMRGILALVESNRALGIANQNLTESNLILSRELSGGLNKEIELVRELKNQIYVDMLFELGVGKGKRWKNKSEAVLELNNLLADALEVRGVGGKKLEAGSQRTG